MIAALKYANELQELAGTAFSLQMFTPAAGGARTLLISQRSGAVFALGGVMLRKGPPAAWRKPAALLGLEEPPWVVGLLSE